MMAINMKNFQNHIKGGFVKIRKFTLVIIPVIFPKNDNLGLELKILNFFRIEPRLC